jgi:post-segregation antitoxin (ccd killing protein)
MGSKKKVLLYIDAETVTKAKESGLNLSKVAENSLKEAVRRLKGMKSETDCQNGAHCSGSNDRLCREWDSNPLS